MVNSFLLTSVSLLFKFIEMAILADVILSWVMPGRRNQFIDLLHVFTEPFMMPGRKLQERLMPGLMIDFSPIIALLLLSFLRNILFRILL